MERKEAIRSAYRLTGSSSFYDGMMTCSTLPGRLVCRLDYDFSLADKDAAMHSGVIARTIVLDRLVGEYLAAHPGATVMNLACGLDTRCYRMQGYAHWYNLDLPETIAVREALLPESGSISQLAMSAMDDWGAAVEGPSGPALVIIEGLTMYLTQADVQRIYTAFVWRHRLCAQYFIDQVKLTAAAMLDEEVCSELAVTDPSELVVSAAVLSGFTRLLAEKLLLLEGKTLADGGSLELEP